MTDQAIELGFGASGCYTFALRGYKPQACESLNQAYRLAESVDMEPSESSIDHPSNADYLSAEMKNDLAPEPQCKSEDSPGPGM